MNRVTLASQDRKLVRNNDLCRIATISVDGWPHCVPVGYVHRNGRFYIPVGQESKKVRNLRANPRACIVIDDEERVLMIQGRIEIVKGERYLDLKKWITKRTGWTLGGERKGAVLVLTPERKATWSTLRLKRSLDRKILAF